ncbi:dual specificity protein phosphatase family protein [bacterium]|nr:dual specificity protein phosphatase family protein [bacterium]
MKARLAHQAAVSTWLSIWFLAVYTGCNTLAAWRPHQVGSLYFEWERHYPFVPVLIIPYWSMDLFFFMAAFLCSTHFQLTQHAKRITAAIAVAGFFFLLFPLTLAWPRPAVPGLLGKLFGSLEVMNNFYNCCPSLHIVLRTCVWEVFALVLLGWPRRLMALWFFLISLSTLLCWQHYIIDVFTGQLLGLLCIYMFPSTPLPSTRGLNSNNILARRYGAGALILLALCLAGWPHGVVLLWPFLSLALLSLAYLGGGPSWLGKVNGSQLHAARWLLNPYRWVAALTARYFTAGRRPYREVAPGLWVGRRLSQQEALAMPAPAVLDLTAEYDEVPALLARTYKNIPILDLTAPSMDQIQEAVDFLKQNPHCYVHCALGLGRVAVVVAAFFLSQGHTLEQALERLAPVHLKPAQYQRLKEFAALIQTTPA